MIQAVDSEPAAVMTFSRDHTLDKLRLRLLTSSRIVTYRKLTRREQLFRPIYSNYACLEIGQAETLGSRNSAAKTGHQFVPGVKGIQSQVSSKTRGMQTPCLTKFDMCGL